MYARAYGKGLPGLPGKALASDTKRRRTQNGADKRKIGREKKKKEKKGERQTKRETDRQSDRSRQTVQPIERPSENKLEETNGEREC